MQEEQIMVCHNEFHFDVIFLPWVGIIISILKQLIYISVLSTCHLLQNSVLIVSGISKCLSLHCCINVEELI